MRFGFLESVYEKCLIIELRKAGLCVETQQPQIVYYDGEVVGEFVFDLIVENEVIVELKSVKQLVRTHEVQLVNYLVATGTDVGLLIDFGETKVEVKRTVRKFRQDEQD